MTPEQVQRQVRLIDLGSRRLVRNLLAGDYASTFRGRGLEFADVREYQPGDDARAIDWQVTARLGTPYIRRYQEERELTIVLVVDCSGSGDVGSDLRTKRELAAHVAAVIALAAARRNDRIGALLFTDTVERHIAPRKGRRHALRLVSEVLAYEPKGHKTDLAAALDYLAPTLPQRAVILILSDFLSPDFEPALARLGARHELIAVQLADRLERALPAAGLVRLWDPEADEWRVIDTGDPAVRAALSERRRVIDDAVERAIERSGADLLRLDAAVPFAEALIAFFHRRAQRR